MDQKEIILAHQGKQFLASVNKELYKQLMDGK